jgi:hypothetical protein
LSHLYQDPKDLHSRDLQARIQKEEEEEEDQKQK